MNTLLLSVRSLLPAWLALGVVLGFSGCHAVDFYEASLQAPAPPAMEPPRELSMVSLPSYRVEPPDILQIEMLKLVPLPPYRIDIYDVLQIRVLGTMLDQPIDGFFLVEGEGIVTLGPAYGRVRVAGMTVEEATDVITASCRKCLNKPEVSVQLARTAGTAAGHRRIPGRPRTARSTCGNTALLHVAGKTITEIRLDLTEAPGAVFRFAGSVGRRAAFNSKVFYVITQGAGLGDNVRRVPITGNETVLDALSVGQRAVAGLQHDDLDCPAGAGRFRLRADFAGRLRGDRQGRLGGHELPGHAGDRVFIAEDGMIAANNDLTKVTAPVERLLGHRFAGHFHAPRTETMGRAYNSLRSGF